MSDSARDMEALLAYLVLHVYVAQLPFLFKNFSEDFLQVCVCHRLATWDDLVETTPAYVERRFVAMC